MAGIFDKVKKRRQFEKDLEKQKKAGAHASHDIERRRIIECLESLVFSQAMDSYEFTDERQKQGETGVEYKTMEHQMIYYETFVSPDDKSIVWNYEMHGNSHERMADLVNQGLEALICFQKDTFEKTLKRKDGRETLVQVTSYQGLPVKRAD